MPDLNKRKLLLKTKTLICKTQNANLKRNLFLKNQPKDLLQVLANGLRYPRWGGGRRSRPTGKCSGVENCLRFRQNPQRRVHALLGSLLDITSFLRCWFLSEN